MKKINTVVFGGYGKVGAVLCRKIRQVPGWKVGGIMTRNKLILNPGIPGMEQTIEFRSLDDLPSEILEQFNIAFLAISSVMGTEDAYDCFKFCSKHDLHVVTCEKVALSHRFEELSRQLHHIGCNAAVGGGTRMLEGLKDRLKTPFPIEFHIVPNATLNCVFYEMGVRGRTFMEAMGVAVTLELVESEEDSPLRMLGREIEDALMKSAIVHNLCLSKGNFLTPQSFMHRPILDAKKGRLVQEAADRRFIVSFLRTGAAKKNDRNIIGGFACIADEWTIQAGFQHLDTNDFFRGWVPKGEECSIITDEGENGRYVIATGPGAGLDKTASAMITDAKIMMEKWA